jgi:hypothetical protein
MCKCTECDHRWAADLASNPAGQPNDKGGVEVRDGGDVPGVTGRFTILETSPSALRILSCLVCLIDESKLSNSDKSVHLSVERSLQYATLWLVKPEQVWVGPELISL